MTDEQPDRRSDEKPETQTEAETRQSEQPEDVELDEATGEKVVGGGYPAPRATPYNV
jgi:hypothetical protein